MVLFLGPCMALFLRQGREGVLRLQKWMKLERSGDRAHKRRPRSRDSSSESPDNNAGRKRSAADSRLGDDGTEGSKRMKPMVEEKSEEGVRGGVEVEMVEAQLVVNVNNIEEAKLPGQLREKR